MNATVCGLALLFLTTQQEPTNERIRALLDGLRSDSTDNREKSAQALADLGEAARPALERAAKSSDAELAGRARDILGMLSTRVAEALFAKMEKAVRNATTVQLEFTCRRKWGAFDNPLKGSITFERETKASLRAQGTYVDPFTYLFISDGQVVREKLASSINSRSRLHDTLHEKLCFSLVRTGVGVQIWLAAVGGDLRGPYWRYGKQRIDIKAKELGQIERLGGRKVKPLHYTMIVHADGGNRPVTFECTVWVDMDTVLPVKRTATCVNGDRNNNYLMTEIYEKVILGKKVDPAVYAFPD